MLIDTHTHLDAPAFDADRDACAERARAAGVGMLVVLPGGVEHFDGVRACARRYGWVYTLGIHPMWTPQADDGDLDRLAAAVEQAKGDPQFIGIGEIGLDFYVPALCGDAARARQLHFYGAQLRLARRHGLPVALHLRRAQDEVLAGLRRIEVPGGFAHAFNGSAQQAGQFVARGFKLGFGGAATFSGSQRIRRLAAELPPQALVLETDSPDIAPSWLERGARNEPAELARIAEVVAGLRGIGRDELAALTRANARAAWPRLAAWLDRPQAAT
jgi:TatD DNase family protein